MLCKISMYCQQRGKRSGGLSASDWALSQEAVGCAQILTKYLFFYSFTRKNLSIHVIVKCSNESLLVGKQQEESTKQGARRQAVLRHFPPSTPRLSMEAPKNELAGKALSEEHVPWASRSFVERGRGNREIK